MAATIHTALARTLQQGIGYWIVQLTGSAVTLDMPAASTDTPVSHTFVCQAFAVNGCFDIPLATRPDTEQWNLIGYPFDAAGANVWVATTSGLCESGCDLESAESQAIVSHKLWSYNGSGYTNINEGVHLGILQPWAGYWIQTLDLAEGTLPKLVLAKP